MSWSRRRSGWARTLAVVVLLGSAGSARAATITLQNDGFVSGDSASFQSGFASGEIGAATLGPVNETFQLTKIHFLFGPVGTADATVTVRIYMDSGTATPGAQIYNADYSITPANDAMHEIDLTAENVTVLGGGSIRVGLEVQHAGAPGIARDDDGSIQPQRNWIFSQSSWTDSNDLGLQGDWIIRAEVETDDPTPDGGLPDGGATDGGVSADAAETHPDGGDVDPGDAGSSNDAGTGGDDDDSGCNCTTTKGGRSGAPGFATLLLLLALVLRRRSSR